MQHKISALFYAARTSGLVFILLIALPGRPAAQPRRKLADTIWLQGIWSFQADPRDQGLSGKWYDRKLTGRIRLPGSMTSNHKGNDISVNTPWTGGIEDSSWFFQPQYAKYRVAGQVKVPFWLQPEKYYKGAAWYQRIIAVPPGWQGRPLELFIERAHWETLVFIDGLEAGSQNSLAAPHRYLLPAGLPPGNHVLTIRVDNRVKDVDVGVNSHSISDHTQGNWNGMIGKIYLQRHPGIYLGDIQLFSDIAKKLIRARIIVKGGAVVVHQGSLSLQATLITGNKAALPPVRKTVQISTNSDTVELIYPMGKHPALWSEFHPALYKISVELNSDKGKESRRILFGMRNFSEKGSQFTINGHLTFLRGTLDCAAFPITGFPPTDVASWTRILKTCKSYGLNHIRFHSWCPPDAAFEAADRLGMYLQIECSSWANFSSSVGDGKPIDQFIYDESNRIVANYGNHPSFCMMVYGNEPAGQHLTEYLTGFVSYWKARDNRRLYSSASGWPVIPEANYNLTPDPRIQQWGQGLKSIINSRKPSTDYDWSNIIGKWQHPTLSHEIGQWCVYPDLKETLKYTGVMKAKNFEIFDDQLKSNGLGAYGDDFLYASGKLQVLCYKAEIEAALRTKGFGGFQLLGLEDFPGQGTAPVGVLNAFYQPKSYVTARQYRQFCNAVVPLARFSKMVYLNSEQLVVPVEIAQFREKPISGLQPSWKISDANGAALFSGNFKKQNIPPGNGLAIGQICQELSRIKNPSLLKLSVTVGPYENSWEFFVYPRRALQPVGGVIVSSELSDSLIRKLRSGASVLLNFKKGSVKKQFGGNIAIGFSSIFWNTAWTHGQPPETLGIICDPENPALAGFPTQSYSNYQWWDAMSHSSPIVLDSVKAGLRPIVRVIDDWVKARSLGLIFECRVGKGKLIVSGVDLSTAMGERPEARQLLLSLENYMQSSRFSPKENVDIGKIIAITQ